METDNRLRELRRQHALTQQELATESHTTRSLIAQIETGRCQPSIKVAKRLAQCLDVDWWGLYDNDSNGDDIS